MEELIKKCKAGVYLTVNQHRDYYMSVADRIKELRLKYDEDISEELEKELVEANTIYELQFYPDTPVGFYRVYGTSLEDVLKKAWECF